MDFAAGSERWTDRAWRDEALRWAADRLAEHGVRVTGAAEQPHVRTWSTALRIPTDAGPVWFKADGAGTAYEAGLVAVLAAHAGDRVVRPYAVDTGRGWLLSPDGGRTLRALLGDAPEPRAWEPVVTGYADLQRRAAPAVGALLAAGVPDRRPDRLPGLFDALLAELGPPPASAPTSAPAGDALTAAERAALLPLRPEVASWSAALAGGGIAPTVEHGDLHTANVLVRHGRYAYFDWGDAAVAHPFHSLLVLLRELAGTCGLGPDDPALLRVRDAYLEPWTAEHDRAALVAQADLAVRTGAVLRAQAWLAAYADAPAEVGRAARRFPAEWLNLLRAPSLLA